MDRQHAPLVMGIYAFTTSCGVAVLYVREWIQLERYLRRAHPEKWAKLAIPFTHSSRPGAIPRFVFSRENLGDPRVDELKRNARVAALLPILLFLHYPLVIGLAFYLESTA